MTDERQRQLEREASSGDIEAEAKLLRERVRSGELTEERLQLAAALGDTASRKAVFEPIACDVKSPQRGIESLFSHSPETAIRLHIAMARRWLAAWLEEAKRLGAEPAVVEKPSAVLRAAELWAVQPSDTTLEALRRVANPADNAAWEWAHCTGGDRAERSLVGIESLGTYLEYLAPSAAVRFASQEWDDSRLLKHATEEVIPWLLGTGDPRPRSRRSSAARGRLVTDERPATHPYCLDFAELDSDKLLEPWDWLLPAPCKLLAATKLGDLFLVLPDDRVILLDLIEGSLNDVAPSPEEFQRLSLIPEIADDWFLPGFVDALEARGERLGLGQCFAFQAHPKIGGSLSSENLKPMNLVAYHIVCSELHKLPPGTPISGFTVDGEEP